MSKQVKLRRGTATEHNTFTGVEGEVTVDTTNDTLRVHDGATAGGKVMARADGSNASGTWAISVTGNADTATALAGTLALASGGTGSTTASGARTNLGAAASGANTDITSLLQSTSVVATGAVAVDSIGYRGAPQNNAGSGYTLVLADQSKLVTVTGGTLTIPSNASVAFPVGTVILIYNNAATSRTIDITSDTLRLAGSATTGSRTLAQYGIATITKVASTTWAISGAGLT